MIFGGAYFRRGLLSGKEFVRFKIGWARQQKKRKTLGKQLKTAIVALGVHRLIFRRVYSGELIIGRSFATEGVFT